MDKTICFAHNSAGFDGWFILNWFYRNDLKVDITLRNNRLLQLRYRPLKLYFKDSFAFIPLPLHQFSATFGLSETKGWYPHKLTCPENLASDELYPAGRFPSIAEFMPKEQKPKQREQLVRWHEEMSAKYAEENLTYDLKRELDKYCEADVKLLAAGTLQFRDKFMSINNGFDPLRDYCTNSSSGLACFRTFYYDDHKVPILLIGENSLKTPTNKSRVADAWLSFTEENLGRPLQREVKIGRYTVDGCDPDRRKIYEFYGCLWHGCPKCRSPNEKCPVSGKTMARLRSELLRKKAFLTAAGYTLIEVKKKTLIRINLNFF